MSKDELPSINDYMKESDLPSYKDFMEKKKELPSVEDYITETNQNYIQEETQTIEDVNGESFLEVSDIVNAPEWSELVRLVNDVRKDIPEIPEIKYYDRELSDICEKIIEIQENLSRFDVKSDKIYELNEKNEEFEVKLSVIESKIPQVPEIKYYDSDIESIYEKIQQISEGIDNLPEIKHYDNELKSLSVELEKVRDRDVPDFRWIGNTFNSIDEDFEKVQGHLSLIRDKIESEVSQLTEKIQVKDFEQNINVKNLSENLNESIKKTNTKLEETKDKFYSELSQSSLKIWEYHREFKDDDKKLKKSILSEQNKLKQSLQKEIKEFNDQSVKTDENLLKFFNDLKVEVSLLPEVKYYDEDILTLKDEIDSLRDGLKDLNEIASLIKKDQKELKENYLLSEPPQEKQRAGGQSDPLTPTGEKFATFKDLESHYRLFLNRIQVQLSTIGGGGAGFIKDLDDVSFDESSGDGKLLIYDQANSKWVGIASTALGSGGSVGAAGTWAATSAGIHTTKNVGIATTARTDYALYVEGDQYIDGNITVGGTITYDDVKNVDSIGIITARTGVDVLAGGINIVGISTISTGIGTVHLGVGATALLVEGDARITGILTIGTASITLNPNTKQVTGIDEIIVGSGASLSLAPLFKMGGTFVVDYSKLTLKGYSSYVNGTYNRQSDSFVLGVAPTYSGSARFLDYSGYYYFLHESDNSKMIIYNIVDGYWSAVYSSGSNFSSPSNYDQVYPVTISHFITPGRQYYDDQNRAYPASGYGIEYATSISEQTSELGIVSGVTTFRDNIFVSDNDRVYFGTDGDLAIFHNSNNGNSVISALQDGNLNINATKHTFKNQAGSETKAIFNDNGSVELYYDNSKKFETTTDGVVVTGIVTATSFIGDGSQLSNIISGVGIKSTSTRIGTGFTDINFTGTGVTIVGSGNTVTVHIPSSNITRQFETSSGVTTDFTITGGYSVGLLDVFVNGVKQINGSDFTANDGSIVTMTPYVNDGDVIEFQKYEKISIAGITTADNSTNLNNQTASYYLDYNNFTNTPTVPTNNNQLTNGAGYITTSFTNTNQLTNGAGFITTSFTNTNQLTNGAGFITNNVSGDVTLTDTATDSSAGPEFKLYRDSSSPDDGDYLGQIKFAGESDTGVERNYAKITGKIGDASNGTEDGILEFAFIKDGSQNINARFKSTELMILNGTDFSVDGNSTFTGTSSFTGNITANGKTIFKGGLVEKFQNVGTTLGLQTSNALSDGNVLLFTGNESGNNIINFTGVHTSLSNGETVSFTTIITPNGSGGISTVQIDGEAISVKWSGGSAPSAGSSGQDVYTFQILKVGTGVTDYNIFGAATNYA